MTRCTVLLRREAWELAAACGYEHHRKHSACLLMTECPAAQWSAQATNGNKSSVWVMMTLGWWMIWKYWTCTLTWRKRYKLYRYGGHKFLLTSSHSPSYTHTYRTPVPLPPSDRIAHILSKNVIIKFFKTYCKISFLFTAKCHVNHNDTRVGTLIVATIYLQMIQNRYMFRSFTVLQRNHQHCVQPVARDVEVVGYL